MDYSKGYSCSYRIMRVDASTWRDVDEIAGVSELSVTRSIDSDAPLVDSGDLAADAPLGREGYVRCWMDCLRDGEISRIALGTFLAQASQAGGDASPSELRSVLQPASDERLPAGWYAPRGVNGPEVAARLLGDAIDAPVSMGEGDGGALADHVVSSGESVLSMAWALCGDDWEIVTDGMGLVTVRPREASATELRACDIIGEVSTSWDVTGVPNRITATDGGMTAVAVNDDSDSPTSTTSRGRVVDASASGTRLAGETLEAFARRCLVEQSAAVESAEYEREWREDVGIGDRVTVPGHSGSWRVVSQQLSIGCGVTVQETAKREVTTYAQG